MTLRTFVWGRAADYGEIVERLPSERAAIPLPDWWAGPVKEHTQLAVPAIDGYGALTDNLHVYSGEAYLARFENVEVQRSNLGFAERYLVILKPGVCLYDSAEADQGGAIWPARLHPETAECGLGPERFDVQMLEEQPVGAVVEEPHVLLSHLWQANYAHTLFETLSRLWYAEVRGLAVKSWMTDIPIIWERTQPWQRELATTLPQFTFVDMPAPRTRYKTLYVPTPRTLSAAHPAKIKHLKRLLPLERIIEAAPEDKREGLTRMLPPVDGGGRKIYISRLHAKERRVVNEMALIEALGFDVFYCETIPPHMQMLLFANADTIVMPHGAAMVNLLWTPPGARVLELVPRSYQHTMWWFWAKWLGHRYGRYVVADDPATRDMTVDVATVLDGLAALG